MSADTNKMSHPNPQHERGNEYPEDKVTHYPHRKNALASKTGHTKAKTVAQFHADQMGHMMGLMRKHHNAKTSALKKRQ